MKKKISFFFLHCHPILSYILKSVADRADSEVSLKSITKFHSKGIQKQVNKKVVKRKVLFYKSSVI